MKNRFGLLIVFPLLTVAGFGCVSAPLSDATPTDAPPLAKNDEAVGKLLTIHEINRQKPTSGVYQTEGFITKIYVAPPCPPGVECKPSMENNVVISEENKSLDTYDLSEKEMVVFTDKTAALKKGGKYRFKIKITAHKTTGEQLNDAALLDFTRLDG